MKRCIVSLKNISPEEKITIQIQKTSVIVIPISTKIEGNA
jgi:hypothetical protein